MGVIVHQCPSVTYGLCFRQKNRQTINQVILILIVSEYLATLNPADDDVMQNTRSVKAG
jgi:hypothetical protein